MDNGPLVMWPVARRGSRRPTNGWYSYGCARIQAGIKERGGIRLATSRAAQVNEVRPRHETVTGIGAVRSCAAVSSESETVLAAGHDAVVRVPRKREGGDGN